MVLISQNIFFLVTHLVNLLLIHVKHLIFQAQLYRITMKNESASPIIRRQTRGAHPSSSAKVAAPHTQ